MVLAYSVMFTIWGLHVVLLLIVTVVLTLHDKSFSAKVNIIIDLLGLI